MKCCSIKQGKPIHLITLIEILTMKSHSFVAHTLTKFDNPQYPRRIITWNFRNVYAYPAWWGKSKHQILHIKTYLSPCNFNNTTSSKALMELRDILCLTKTPKPGSFIYPNHASDYGRPCLTKPCNNFCSMIQKNVSQAAVRGTTLCTNSLVTQHTKITTSFRHVVLLIWAEYFKQDSKSASQVCIRENVYIWTYT